MNRKRGYTKFEIWPGFVDILTTLLMTFLFIICVFMVSQGIMNKTITSKNDTLKNLESSVKKLSSMLRLAEQKEKKISKELIDKVKKLENEQKEKEELSSKHEMLKKSESELSDLQAQIEEILKILSKMGVSGDSLEEKIQELKESTELALYKSEFFGKIREALKDNPSVIIKGDRFVFPSEIFFNTGSDTLEREDALRDIVRTIKKVLEVLPDDIPWILRIEGHTDKKPVKGRWESNWALSNARALSIVKFLIAEGLSPKRLVSAGFGEHQPIDEGEGEESLKKNRRIEIKLDQR
jgi:chemotaxis protein MotB